MSRGKTRKRGRTLYDLPTYVINMKERPDRWARFKSHDAVLSFRKLQRFPAVNGKRLKYKQDRRISIKTRMNISRNYRRSHYEIATLGAIGSSISHISVWKKFVASGAPMCLVLEDDVILSEVQVHAASQILSNLPSECGIWILGCYLPNLIIQPEGQSKWSHVHKFTAAHAYILTRDAAKKLLEEPYPIEMHIEYYMVAGSMIKGFKIMHHEDVHFEFFRKQAGPRTSDSNTSQHKKSGCPSCDYPDDYKQLYRGMTRKTKNGIKIAGVIEGEQPRKILTLTEGANRNNSVHP
jgi:hypothetical protein